MNAASEYSEQEHLKNDLYFVGLSLDFFQDKDSHHDESDFLCQESTAPILDYLNDVKEIFAESHKSTAEPLLSITFRSIQTIFESFLEP